ncbi:Rv0340 family IniB-related protein [uncultured Mycolicibacterium sp.]|uniref:Rv0340 family IniB-related protein n=1 Tax=uncultured Mycolicibacterium sp. TaxID=2320817 RepID=UPI002618B742|nr:Rv0340 family IniB-related protein [uncultured Mycolicibacterium sp.]
MANPLLDFVLSLARDPDAAARYAADPAKALADAGLTGVTSADVDNLMPVVAESLAMTSPAPGDPTFGAGTGGNVWASGAATAAFDAFDAFGDELPAPVPVSAGPVIELPEPAGFDPGLPTAVDELDLVRGGTGPDTVAEDQDQAGVAAPAADDWALGPVDPVPADDPDAGLDPMP